MRVFPDADALPSWLDTTRLRAVQAPPDGGSGRSLAKFSLAGVGLKFSMLRQGSRLTLPASGRGGDWIVKLPDPKHDHVPVNEFAVMSLAARVGVDVPEVSLASRDELPDLPPRAWPTREDVAFLIKRFDRGDQGRLIHIEDFAQIRG